MATNINCEITFPLVSEEKSLSVYDANGLYITSIFNHEHKTQILERVNGYDELLRKNGELADANGIDYNLHEKIIGLSKYYREISDDYQSSSKQVSAEYNVGFDKGVSFAYGSVSVALEKLLELVNKVV